MSKSSKLPEQGRGVVDAGVAALLHWNTDTNGEAAEEMRSGRIVAESEHEEVRLEEEAAAALHLNGDALAGSTESEYAAGGLFVEAAAAEAVHHLDTNMNAAATDSEHKEGELVAEAALAVAALGLDEDASTAAAKERPRRRDAMSESPENKNENTCARDVEIRSLVEERRNTAKGEKQTAGTEMSSVENQIVGRDSRLCEDIWLNKSPVFMEIAWKMRYRIILRVLLEEVIRGTERVRLNGQRERHVWDKEEKQEDPFVHFTLNTVLQMALKDDVEHWQKSKRHGLYDRAIMTLIASQNVRYARRSLVHYFAGASPKNNVLLQAEYWRCRIENPRRHDENSEQTKYEQKKRSGDQQY